MLGLVCFFTVRTQAADKGITLKGKLMCGNCELKQARKCATVIRRSRLPSGLFSGQAVGGIAHAEVR